MTSGNSAPSSPEDPAEILARHMYAHEARIPVSSVGDDWPRTDAIGFCAVREDYLGPARACLAELGGAVA